MSKDLHPKNPPPDWGADKLSNFIGSANYNCWATFHNMREPYEKLSEIDTTIEKLINAANFSKHYFAAFFLLQSHAAYRAGARFRQQITLWDPPRLEAVLTRLTQAEAECKRTGLRDTTVCSRTLMSITASATRI